MTTGSVPTMSTLFLLKSAGVYIPMLTIHWTDKSLFIFFPSLLISPKISADKESTENVLNPDWDQLMKATHTSGNIMCFTTPPAVVFYISRAPAASWHKPSLTDASLLASESLQPLYLDCYLHLYVCVVVKWCNIAGVCCTLATF